MKTSIQKIGLLLTFIIGLFLYGNAQSTEVQFIITTIDGLEQTYPLTGGNHIWFENGTTLDLEIGDVIIEYALADIRKITCCELENLSEKQSTSAYLFPNPVHDAFLLYNLGNNQTISIYTLDGRLVKSVEVTENQPIDISNLPLGLYFVKTNSCTLKMIKL